jgi:hypothetical protein
MREDPHEAHGLQSREIHFAFYAALSLHEGAIALDDQIWPNARLISNNRHHQESV